MKILIANDDGIDSPGIAALADAVAELGEVIVVAPHRERSTSGHSLTLHKPLRIFEVAKNRYSTSGTPADCIYLGIREIMKTKPDLILSGINAGANLGTDVYYSGTVAAAREGALINVPSYAFSMVDLRQIHPNAKVEPMRYDVGAKVALDVIKKTQGIKFPAHTLINVNIPNMPLDDILGLKIARQGFRYYSSEVTHRADPRGKAYYWIGGAYLGFQESPLSDCHAVNEGYTSVTPLTIDCTDNELFESLRENGFKA